MDQWPITELCALPCRSSAYHVPGRTFLRSSDKSRRGGPHDDAAWHRSSFHHVFASPANAVPPARFHNCNPLREISQSFTAVEFCDYSSVFRETGSSGSWKWESCASVNSALNPTPRTRPAGGSHFITHRYWITRERQGAPRRGITFTSTNETVRPGVGQLRAPQHFPSKNVGLCGRKVLPCPPPSSLPLSDLPRAS